MNRLFAALMSILLLALPIAAFAEGTETPPAETETPAITPEPTPEPTPVADKLIIDSWNLYDGMDKTYGSGLCAPHSERLLLHYIPAYRRNL